MASIDLGLRSSGLFLFKQCAFFQQRAFLPLIVAAVLAITSQVAAQNDDSSIEKKKKPLPKSGTLSTSIGTGSASSKTASTWGSEDGMGNGSAPVGGSVSRVNASNWQLKVINQSTDIYSVNLSVLQLDARGSQVKSDSYSYTLKPGQSESRLVSAAYNAANASLELRSFTNISEKKRAKEKKDTEGKNKVGTAPDVMSDPQSQIVNQ